MSEPHAITKVLEEAFAEASRLPEEEQLALAEWLMEELSSDRRWRAKLSASRGQLAELAAEALAEHRAARTTELNPDTL